MKTITKRELNQQTAKVLAQVEAGETVIVTERGIPKWRIEQAHLAVDPLEHWRRQGSLTTASENPESWPDDEPATRTYTADEIEALVDDIRGDR